MVGGADAPIKEAELGSLRDRYQYTTPPEARPSLKELWTAKRAATQVEYAAYKPLDWVALFVPAVGWLRTYGWRSDDLLKDVVAGLSIAAMIVPHGLSYAKQNGGLPPVFGLYNAFICVLIYSAFGTCRTLSVGPVAIIYALIYNGLKDINPTYLQIKDNNAPKGAAQIAAQQDFNTLFLQVTLLVGFIQLVAYACRLSFLLKFLSRSIMSGFTTAVAVIFILSQLKSILGYATTSSNRVYLQIFYLCKNIGNFQWQEFVMGVSMLILLFGLNYLSYKFPRYLKYAKVFGPLIAMVLAIVITASARLDKHGIKIVGKIPRGLPPVTVDRLFPMEHFSKQFTVALTAACVSFLDANAIGKVVAAKHHYRTDNDREFFAISLMNLVAPLFSATTTSGNFSRTAVWTAIGGKSQLAGFITAWLVALCLGVATEAFKYIPNNTLAAITIYGLVGLFDGQHLIYLWKVSKSEFIIWNVAFWVACLHSIEVGLGASIGASIAFYVLRSMFAPIRAQGEIEDSKGNTVYRVPRAYLGAQIHDAIPVIRIDADIYFSTVERLHDRAMAILDQSKIAAKFLVLDLAPSAYIDSTGIHFLKEMVRGANDRGAILLLANPQPALTATLQKAGVLESLGAQIFVSVADAVDFAKASLSESGLGLTAGKV